MPAANAYIQLAEDPQGAGEHGEEGRLRQKGGVRMKITIYRNGNDGGLSIEDGESEADVTRVIMQSAVSFVVSSVPSDLNNTQKEEIVRNFAKAA